LFFFWENFQNKQKNEFVPSSVDTEVLVPADGASEEAERKQAAEAQGRDAANMYDQLSQGLFLAQEQSVRLQARSRGDREAVLI